MLSPGWMVVAALVAACASVWTVVDVPQEAARFFGGGGPANDANVGSRRVSLKDGIKAATKKANDAAAAEKLQQQQQQVRPAVVDDNVATLTTVPSTVIWSVDRTKGPSLTALQQGFTCDHGHLLLTPTIAAFRSVQQALKGVAKHDELKAALTSHITDGNARALLAAATSEDLAALFRNVSGAAVVSDGYCDCVDGTDELATGACDSTLGRQYRESTVKAPRRCKMEALRSAHGRLYGARLDDDVPDCCDCSDEPHGGPCRRNCESEISRAKQFLLKRKAELSSGVAKCQERAKHGADVFGPAFKALLADREAWIAEATTFVKNQIELRYKPEVAAKKKKKKKKSAESGQDADAMMPEAELRKLADYVQTEAGKQQAAVDLVSASGLGQSFQYYVFAPKLQQLGGRGNESDPGALARRARFLVALEHKPTCMSITRHETSFRGGSADPDSFNFTFALCPFEYLTMVKTSPDGSIPADATPTLLGKYRASGVAMAFTAFHSFFAAAQGRVVTPGSVAAFARPEDPVMYFVMQGVNMRPNAINSTHVVKSPPADAVGQSPLHPFDYDLASGPSVQRRTAFFAGGEACWGGPQRHVRLAFVCGDADALLDVRENGKCAYEVVVITPSACCDGPTQAAPDVTEQLAAIATELHRIESKR